MSLLNCVDSVTVNKTLVKLTNPTVGVYFAVVLELLKIARDKNKFDQITGMWKVDRSYISSETGICPTEQRTADKVLARLAIVNICEDDSDKIAIDMKKYIDTLGSNMSDPTTVLPKSVKLTKAEQIRLKREYFINNLIGTWGLNPESTTNEEVTALKNLIDTYYDRGICKKEQWKLIFNKIKSCAKDSEAVVEIIEYVLATGYQSIPVAIDQFMKRRLTNPKSETKESDFTKNKSGKMLVGIEF